MGGRGRPTWCVGVDGSSTLIRDLGRRSGGFFHGSVGPGSPLWSRWHLAFIRASPCAEPHTVLQLQALHHKAGMGWLGAGRARLSSGLYCGALALVGLRGVVGKEKAISVPLSY